MSVAIVHKQAAKVIRVSCQGIATGLCCAMLTPWVAAPTAVDAQMARALALQLQQQTRSYSLLDKLSKKTKEAVGK